jgi:phosphotriesterase-related protein
MADVITVLGPVLATDLGITLAHEHLMLDLGCLWHEPIDPARRAVVDMAVSRENRDLLCRDPYQCRDNLVLDSQTQAIEELGHFTALGGGAVIDLSTRAIGPYPRDLAAISRQSGLHIVAGCGFYTQRAHPGWVAVASKEALAEAIISELTDGFAEPNTAGAPTVRAGIIGEIGTSSPIHANEERVLRAAARAQRLTGAAINVHLAIFGHEGVRVLDILEDEGADLTHVALSHLDENLDPEYHKAIAKRGAYLEFDTFGSECHFDEDGLREPTDLERIEALLRLLDGGYVKQMLLSQDVCTKMQWRIHGGAGYDHLLRVVAPQLRAHGVGDAAINTMLIDNPARLLAGHSEL